MKNAKQKLAKILSTKDERDCAKSFEKFCAEHSAELPLPGENKKFDKAMWAASANMALSKGDEAILNRVTARMLGEQVEVAKAAVLKLKDLVGNTKEAAINAWQDMLASMSWQQMV